MIIKPIKTRLFQPREKLLPFLDKYLPQIKEGSVVVVTSKIVALSEGRFADKVDDDTKAKIIKQESEFVLQTKYVCLTIKDGIVMANAGVDESNANGKIILLPKDSFESAKMIRNYLRNKYNIKNLGVIITDSRTHPLRSGITGVALGYAGFKGLKDYTKKSDIFGRPFHFSRVDMADSLATSAVLCMGEGNEKCPLALITDVPIEFSNRINRNELKIDIEDDIYGPMFEAVKKK
jgi:coenzyme F420-0:L-glutamate ligase